MGEKKPKLVVRRKVETVRERAEKAAEKRTHEPRRRKVATAAAKPVKGVRRALKREFHPIKTPDNKVGRFLGKKRGFIPKYLKDSFSELKLVSWPTFRQAVGLTLNVIVFSVAIGVFVKIVDYGFEKIVKGVILK